jgi:hypothetical protein
MKNEWEDLVFRVRHYAKRKYGGTVKGITLHMPHLEKVHYEPFPEEKRDPDRPRWDSGSEPQYRNDWQVVYWPGLGVFHFSNLQSQVVRVLWANWEQGGPPMRQTELLDAADSDCKRLVDLFRRSKAWGVLIRMGDVGGTYRLPDLAVAHEGEQDADQGGARQAASA